MAFLYKDFGPTSAYKDSQFNKYGLELEQEDTLRFSSTIYVGNLSFYTTEEQIYELFVKCGEIRRIIMGLDKFKKTPCGFCFVEYYTHEEASDCIKYINGTKLDDRVIRADWDIGFREGRQYGRGKTGGQVRDEYRTDYDIGRGGFGKQTQTPTKDAKSPVAITKLPTATETAPTHYNAQFQSSGYNWREKGQDMPSKKRERGQEDEEPSMSKKSKSETDAENKKNPRFREDKEESDEDA